jgi:hypothetical protein
MVAQRGNGDIYDLDLGCGDPPKRRLYLPISREDWLGTVGGELYILEDLCGAVLAGAFFYKKSHDKSP